MKKASLLAIKEQLKDNLETLREQIMEWKNFGFSDPDDMLYNHVVDMIDDVDGLKTKDDLEVLMLKAQDVEKSIEFFLAKEGQSSLELSWPDIA